MNAPDTTRTGSVYLTFDDGPDPEWTPRILDLLAQTGVHAAFFVVGEFARKEPTLLRRIAAEGHAIGNHTLSHRHPWMLKASAARREVREGAEAIAQIVGQRPRFYRAPHGRNRRCMTDEATQLGSVRVGWNLSAIDWGPLGTSGRIAARLNDASDGDVILMHDGRNRHNRPDELLRVLPEFLRRLPARNLHPRSLDERSH